MSPTRYHLRNKAHQPVLGHTAAIVANLDAAVSVDTSVMHLAGAMAKPTFVLLGVDTDRKFPLGYRNPFYPTIKQT
jgi:ADP-heptose:LPS heptosyltransferase